MLRPPVSYTKVLPASAVADSVVLRIDAIVVECAASGIENDVETDAVSYKIRKRTVAAVVVVARSSVVVVAM